MKEENLFDLSNAELKDRLRADGIAYKENATKRELVALLNGDGVAEENVKAAESTLSGDELEESQESLVSKDERDALLSVDEQVGVEAESSAERELREENEALRTKVAELEAKAASERLAVDKAATLHGHIEDLKTVFN